MVPKAFAPALAGSAVKLGLSGVRLSCAGAAVNTPCALLFYELDEPGFYCNFGNALGGAAVTGPFAATLSPYAVNETELHAAHLSPCATECDRSPDVLPVLTCPLPDDLAAVLPHGEGNLSLAVTFYAPASSAAKSSGRGQVRTGSTSGLRSHSVAHGDRCAA